MWHTNSADAANLYLAGIGASSKDDDASIDYAATALDSCCVLDANFGPAYSAAGFADVRKFDASHDNAWLSRAEVRGRTLLARFPEIDDAFVLLGDVMLKRSQPDSAASMFRLALARDPSNVGAAQRLGRILAESERLDEAEGVYAGLTKAKPDYWVPHRTLGVFYNNQDRVDDATRELQRAVALAPHDALSLTNLGAVYYRQGDWTKFRELSLESFRIRPNCLSCDNVATALFFERKYAESAKYFELALSPEYCDSTDHLAWGNLASALYWVDGQRDRAIALYRKAARLADARLADKPDDHQLVGNLIDYYAMSGDSTQAMALIARADSIVGDDEHLMYRIGSAYEKLGRREQALHQLGDAFRHGMPLPEIAADPSLRDLVNDPIFKEMVRSQEAADGAKTATVNR